MHDRRLIALLSSLITLVLTATISAQCPPHPAAIQWHAKSGGNGHYYARIDEPMEWEAAQARAVQLGGYLATIGSQAENDFVMQLCLASPGPLSWLGGRLVAGNWRWVTGEPWDYTNWAPGEPNNTNGVEQYLIHWPGSTQWNDGGRYQGTFIVEWSTGIERDCDGNGICDTIELAADPALDLNGDGLLDVCQCIPFATAQEWRKESGGNGHFYARFDIGVLWTEARDHALQLGGHLATITSAAENAFVASVAADGFLNVKHLGGYREGSTWRWVTGEPWQYTSWYPGEPNNGNGNEIYLATWVIPGTWNDIYPEYAAGFVVEWNEEQLDCNANGSCDSAEIAGNPGLDINLDGTIDSCQCIADVIADGVVNGVDLASVINDWGMADSPADIDRNGTVGGSDLAIILSAWGPCAP